MKDFSKNLYRAEQVRAMDRFAIEQTGITGYELMRRAGQAAFELAREVWPEVRRMTIFCGAGNNAGDGYVVAKLAQEANLQAEVVALSDPEQLKGEALLAFQAWQRQGGQTHLGLHPKPYGLIVDALLGTGLDREVTGDYLKAIESINQSQLPVLAIDIPSGLNADSGVAMGLAVQAHHTINFIGQKRGLYTGAGRARCGQIHYHDLGVSDAVFKSQPVETRLSRWQEEQTAFQPRSRDAHKGDHGHALLVGGDAGFTGAIRLASESAARCGAGLVSVATRAAHAALINLGRPELMCHGVESAQNLTELLNQASAVGIGPGLGQSRWAQQLLDRVREIDGPMVLDADALNLLAQEPGQSTHWILTPHPGEAARLLDCSTAEIQQDRFAAVRTIQAKYGGVVVLKGSGSLVLGPSGPISVCYDGNPGMATGGMGDVLTGILTSLLAQGWDASTAARVGVALHAALADAVAQDGERGLLASDLFALMRRYVNPAC